MLEKLSAIKRLITVKRALFICLVLVIIILWVLFNKTSNISKNPRGRFGPLTPPQPVHQSSQNRPSEIKSSIPEKPSLPQEISVFRQRAVNISKERAGEIATALGIQSQPKDYTNALVFRQDEKILTINIKGKSISYSEPLPEYLYNLNQQSLEEYALLLVRQIMSESIIWENPVLHTQYLTTLGIHESQPAIQSSADAAIVDLFPVLDGIKIIGPLDPFGYIGMATVSFSKKDRSVGLRTAETGIDFAEKGIYPLQSLATATQELAGGKALNIIAIPVSQLYVKGAYGQIVDPVNADFMDVELVYYSDPNPESFIQPMYLFSGNVTLKDDTSATVKAILPAIDPQYLKSP